VQEWARILPAYFPVFTRFARILTTHDPQLRATLAGYARGIDTLGDVLRTGALKLELIPDKDARCGYGTAALDPRSTTRRELVKGGHCPASFPKLQRGAAHAPGPVPAP
jgi:phospholipid/cholesterol/gamma-HCH transport system substrate-binding protein